MIHKLLLSILLVAALLLSACGSAPAAQSDPGAAPTPAAETSAAPTAESGAAPAPAAVSSGGASAKPPARVEPTTPAKPGSSAGSTGAAASGETRDIKDISSSLDGLESYRLRFSFAFDGKDDQGKPQKGGMEFAQEIIRGSQDRHIRWTATGNIAAGASQGSFELFQVGGSTYIYSAERVGDQKCIGMTGGQDGGGLGEAFKPSDVIGGLEQARLVGKGEQVNRIVADHYSFDQSALSFGAFASAQGDVWVAQDGGFLVKYVGTATGKNSFMSSVASEGTFTWEYNLTDANQVEAIELPKECAGQQPAGDIPTPKNATDKGGFGKLITFNSPDAPADVAAFYKEAMPAQGWQAGEANALGELQTLNYSKGGRKISITITKEGQGGSTVLINEE